MSGSRVRPERPSSRLWSGSSEVEKVGEDLSHLGERLWADVADRFSEPLDSDRSDVLALRRGHRFEPVVRVGFDGYLGPVSADG